MKKLLAIILAAGMLCVGGMSVSAEEYLTPGNEEDYKWEKVYATEFNALKKLSRDENGNVLLDGTLAENQNYISTAGYSGREAYQTEDGVIYLNTNILWGGSPDTALLKTENGLTGYRTGAGNNVVVSGIGISAADMTKNAGGSLLSTIGNGEWYKVTADVAVGGADHEGEEIPVAISSTNKLDEIDAFIGQWQSINRLRQNVPVSTAKDANELKPEDFRTLTYYIHWWSAGSDDWTPKNIVIGVAPENATTAKEYVPAYFNENGDYFITLRRVMVEKGIPLTDVTETIANANNFGTAYESLNAFTHNGAGDYNYGNIVTAPYCSNSGWLDWSGDTPVGYVDIMPLGDDAENFGFYVLNMAGTDDEGKPIYNKFSTEDYGGEAILKFGFDVFGFASNTDVEVSVETITGVDIEQNMQIRGDSAVGMANKATFTINGKQQYADRDLFGSIEYRHEISEKTKDVIGYKVTVEAEKLFDPKTGSWPKLYENSDGTASLNACLRADHTNVSLGIKKPAAADFRPKLEKIDDGYMAYAPYCKDENAKSIFAVYSGENRLDRVEASAPNRYFKDDKYEKGQNAKLFIWNGFDLLNPLADAANVK